MKARTMMVALFMAAATTMAFAQESTPNNEKAPMEQGARRGGARAEREEGGERGPKAQMQGQRPGGQGQQRGGRQQGGINFRALDFDDAQMAQVKEIDVEYRKKVIAIRADIQIAKLDLNSELFAKESNTKKITTLTETITLKTGELMTAKNDKILAIKAICTAEQLEKLANMPMGGRPQGNRPQGGNPQGQGGRPQGGNPPAPQAQQAK